MASSLRLCVCTSGMFMCAHLCAGRPPKASEAQGDIHSRAQEPGKALKAYWMLQIGPSRSWGWIVCSSQPQPITQEGSSTFRLSVPAALSAFTRRGWATGAFPSISSQAHPGWCTTGVTSTTVAR